MTVWRHRRAAMTTFFRKLDDRKPPESDVARTDRASIVRSAVRSWRRARLQIPSLLLSSSLTAPGFALPPDAFITCPTNQPIIVGLALAWATLSGFWAMISSTIAAIAERSL